MEGLIHNLTIDTEGTEEEAAEVLVEALWMEFDRDGESEV